MSRSLDPNLLARVPDPSSHVGAVSCVGHSTSGNPKHANLRSAADVAGCARRVGSIRSRPAAKSARVLGFSQLSSSFADVITRMRRSLGNSHLVFSCMATWTSSLQPLRVSRSSRLDMLLPSSCRIHFVTIVKRLILEVCDVVSIRGDSPGIASTFSQAISRTSSSVVHEAALSGRLGLCPKCSE